MKSFASTSKFLSCVAVASLFSGALAWHEAGHRAVGAIALKELTPTVKAKVVDLLKSLPDPSTPRDSVLQPDPFHPLPTSFTPAAKAKLTPASLETAAAWPDKVRPRKNYDAWLHHGDWHFINFSLNGPGGNAAALTGGKAVDVIVNLTATLRDTTLPKPTRAIALAWIAHLVGDIHQPLHAVAYFDAKHPQGDRGGNEYLLNAKGKAVEEPNLHSFWDGVVGEGPSDVPTLLGRLASLPKPTSAQTAVSLTSLKPTVLGWAQESVEISKKSVYRLDASGTPKLSPYAAKFDAKAETKDARKAADPRVKLAGYRLASLLNEALK